MTDQAKKPRARAGWWITGVLVLLAAVVTAGWWLAGRRVWTDDRTIRVVASDAKLREVLWTQPELLGEEFNTEAQEYEPSLSPDSTEMYFVRGKVGKNADIYVSYRRNNKWAEPAPLDAINTADSDDVGPRLTPDGRFLLFYSDRKGGEGGYDIWAAERTDAGFAEPFNLGPQINTEFNEYNPAPTPDGKRLFFATNRKAMEREQKEPWRATIRQSGMGDYDLFVADLDETATPDATTQPAPASTQPAEQLNADEAEESEADGLADALSAAAIIEGLKKRVELARDEEHVERPATQTATAPALVFKSAAEVPGVNTPYHEGASCLSPAGDFLYFASNRPGGSGKFDLYRVRIRDGAYGEVENLGKEINTAENEADPQLAMGGFHLFFSSDRPGVHADSYDLLSAESREVYVVRQGRPLPNLGWSVWLLLGALALLLPLLLFLRGWDDRRLNLLQKCLLVSLLIHVLLTILFSAVMVSKEIVNHVRKQQEMEIAITLTDSTGIEVASEVRQQISDTPIDIPEPTELAQTEMPIELPTPAELEQVNLPQSQIDPTAMAIEVPAPRVAPPTAPSEQVRVAPPVQAQATVPQVQLQPQQRVSQDEAQMQVAPADAPTARAETAPAPQAAPQVVQVEIVPVRVEADSLATAADVVRPNVPAPQAVKAAPEFEPAQASAQPTVEGPQVQIAKVSSASREAPVVQDTVVDLPRQEMAAAKGEASTVQTALPPAQRTAQTLASAAEIESKPVPQAVQVDIKPQVERAPDAIAVAPPTGQPLQKLNEAAPTLQGVEENLPQAKPAKMASTADLAKAVGVPQVAARAEPVKAETIKGEALVAVRKPPTRPTEVAEMVKTPVTADLGIAPQSVALKVNAKPVQVATASPAAPQATEGTVQSQRQETAGPAATAKLVSTDVPTTAATPATADQSLASAASAAPRRVELKSDLPSFTSARPIDTAEFSLPKGSLPKLAAQSDAKPAADPSADAPASVASRAEVPTALSGPRKIELAAGPTPTAFTPDALTDVGPSVATRPRVTDIGPATNFRVGVAAPKLSAPAAMFQRSVEARKPILEKMGGTRQSEEAVDRALAYLARNQEPDGRWTHVAGDSKPGERGEAGPHDPACTGLAVLAFLANDHTPVDPGPYQKVVANGVDFLIGIQGADGDLRGKRAGAGSGAGNMYDHGIATFALAEAALMTGDKRITDAAFRACDFIVKAQHAETGGWRYVPGEAGDTSVFGWQVMALHSAEQLGYKISEACRAGMFKYIEIASQGEHKSLGGYQPGGGATPPMTAELLFCRIMLEQEISDAQEKEVSVYLTRALPEAGNADYYGWYYGSLSLIQLQNDAWTTWNERTRETLIAMQTKEGDNDGMFDGNITWRDQGGRIYTTALGALTLQVYYRYLPTRGE